MARIPLGGRARNYDSKKSRESLSNLIFENNRDASFLDIRRTEGLTKFSTSDFLNPVRSNMVVLGSLLYFIAGTSLFSSSTAGVITNLGTVGGDVGAITGTQKAQLTLNSKGSGAEILILDGSGDGFIFTVSGGLAQITDADFLSSTKATILSERFWLARDGTNNFFASDISDGTSYTATAIGTADESPDDVVNVIAKKSALWVLGERETEFYQTTDDSLFPLRRVPYSTIERGILAKDSLAEVGDSYAFLADDGTVRLVQDTTFTRISDLELELKLKGNGTARYPGFSSPSTAFGFFVDGPVHKVYYLTFPSDDYTWGYDIVTGLTHTRDSDDLGPWRIGTVTLFNNKLIGGDWKEGNLWILDAAKFDEGGRRIRTSLTTPPISFEYDITIPLIELEMEVGQITDATDPLMDVYYSKNGGDTWITHEPISLGKAGEFGRRIVLRQFGRLVRHTDFLLKLEITHAVPTRFYSAWIYSE